MMVKKRKILKQKDNRWLRYKFKCTATWSFAIWCLLCGCQ